VAYVNSSNLTGSASATAAVPVPSGAASGQIAVVGIYKENTAAVTPPAGFTLKATLNTTATARGSLYVFWKRLTGADSGTYSFSWTGADWRAAVCGLFSGRVGSGDPFDGTVGTAESTTAVTSLNVSTSPTNASGDAVGMWTDFTGGNAWTAPTNYTERQDIDVITLDTRDAVASGTTGSLSATGNISGFMKGFLGVLQVAGGGTTTPVSVSGSTTPAGALVRQPAKIPTGSVTPTGAAVKKTVRTVTGTVTPSGLALKQLGRALAGTVTPAGALSTIRTRLIALAGAVTPTGTAARLTAKRPAGATTPTGTVAKLAGRLLAGAVTPAGTLGSIRTRLVALVGAVAPSGALGRQPGKTAAGSITPTGSVARSLARRVTGAVAPVGALATTRTRLLALAGALTPAGVVAKRIGRSAAGAVTPAGAAAKTAARVFGGGVTPAGVMLKLLGRLVAGSVVPSGSVLTESNVQPIVTPPERTVSTPAESRTVVTPAEDRTALVAAEERTVEA
jgi:hypothetical protein